MFIPFAKYEPDRDPLSPESSRYISNVIPDGDTYIQAKSLFAQSSAANSQATGAYEYTTGSGANVTIVGSLTKAEKVTSSAVTDISRVGGYTNAPSDRWQFTQFGPDIIAVTGRNADQPQRSVGGGVFADIGTSTDTPYGGKCIATLGDFVVMGNVVEHTTFTQKLFRVHWSAIGDPTDWTVSATTQCGYQDLSAEYGEVKAIIGGEVGYIFQERAITRMTYVGSPVVFQFDTVVTNQGAISHDAVIDANGLIYFLGQDGFYVFDGQSIQDIGDQQVNRTFLENLNDSYKYLVTAAYDPMHKAVVWSYPSGSNTTCNALLYYSLKKGPYKWSVVSDDTETIFTTNIDGDRPKLGAIDTSHKVATQSGISNTSYVYTGWHSTAPYRSMITKLRPVLEEESNAASILISGKEYREESPYSGFSFSELSDKSWSGRIAGRYFRARVELQNGARAKGIEVEEMRRLGKR